ncbi:death effector domain-containing 1 isoform X2 [Denticeps clupeoides]|uniref:DED domain-containing protein n=1 Tax=Denticeps clupeoides TaxID=299321 RepID=A0AAY4ADF5_9TELE|nr:DNA-binding death effector domain-containing protein 2 isoform X2 [Denticeps clupeoides]
MAKYSRSGDFYWEETECLTYYEMLSLHELFAVVGSQLTATDVEVLSFLLDETYSGRHPLDPDGWTEASADYGGPPEAAEPPSPLLVRAWRRSQPRGSPCPVAARHRPKSGVELLLALERRGYLGDSNLRPLLQLLRVLTRHDLLPFVSHKKRRTVSPQRSYDDLSGMGGRGNVRAAEERGTKQETVPSSDCTSQNPSSDVDQPGSAAGSTRRRRGKARPRNRKKAVITPLPPAPQPAQNKVTCDVQLRVRAEYMEHDSVLRNSIASDKQQPLERQFELLNRASQLLRARDLGSIVCDIKFSELANLDAFWADYLSGALLEALKGVFITDSLKRAAGQEAVRLLVSVDQDDYERGRKLLVDSQSSAHCSTGGY